LFAIRFFIPASLTKFMAATPSLMRKISAKSCLIPDAPGLSCNQVDLRQKIGLGSRFGFILLLGRAKTPKFTYCRLSEADPTTCTGNTSVGT
jgi:hypothetical protein